MQSRDDKLAVLAEKLSYQFKFFAASVRRQTKPVEMDDLKKKAQQSSDDFLHALDLPEDRLDSMIETFEKGSVAERCLELPGLLTGVAGYVMMGLNNPDLKQAGVYVCLAGFIAYGGSFMVDKRPRVRVEIEDRARERLVELYRQQPPTL